MGRAVGCVEFSAFPKISVNPFIFFFDTQNNEYSPGYAERLPVTVVPY
jgi:hypothetical protein